MLLNLPDDLVAYKVFTYKEQYFLNSHKAVHIFSAAPVLAW